MATREDDLNELADMIATAIERAHELKLPTSAYILSMALVEVSDAIEVAVDNGSGDDSAA